MTMPAPMAAHAVLDREFLEIRAKILELAASFDRLDRGGSVQPDDRRLKLIADGVKILLGDAGDRAERLQLLFSRPYSDDWRLQFGIAGQADPDTE